MIKVNIESLPENYDKLFWDQQFHIGKEHSFHGRMWQCMREIETRYDSLVNINFEIENQKDDIILKKIEKDKKIKVVVIDEELSIEIRKIDRSISHMTTNLLKLETKKKNIELESAKFVEILEELVKTTPFVDYNNEEAQKEYFENKFANEINLNILLGHPINNELVRSTMCLGDNSKIKTQLVESLSNIQRKFLTNDRKDK
jgi:hypothetical protein